MDGWNYPWLEELFYMARSLFKPLKFYCMSQCIRFNVLDAINEGSGKSAHMYLCSLARDFTTLQHNVGTKMKFWAFSPTR